jgi:hypothetical protein
MVTPENQRRRDFWRFFMQELTDLGARMERGNETSRWLSVTSQPIAIAHYLSADSVGIFVRAQRAAEVKTIKPFLAPRAEGLARELKTEFEPKWSNELLSKRIELDMSDSSNWPAAVAWLAEWSPRYEAALLGKGHS